MSATDSVTDAPARRGLGRPFAAQLTSTGLANLGDGVLQTLAPLIALGLTSSPAQLSLLAAATWLPWLLLGIAAGVLVDRVNRASAQIVALLARAVLLGGGAWLATTGSLTMPALVGIALLYGVTEVVADLGATAIIPDLVPLERLSAANGRILGVQQVANAFLGAPLAGALLVVGVGVGLGASAALAALAACVLLVGLRRRVARPGRAAAEARGARAALHEVREGLSLLAHHPVMRPLVLSSGLLNMASTGYFAVFVLWVVGPTSRVGLTAAQYPLLMLGFAAGAVAGSFAAAPVQARLGERSTILLSLTVNSALLLTPLWLTDPWLYGVVFAVVGALNTIGNVVGMSLRQRLVPRELLGRVGGASRTLSYGLMPIGAILGGVVAERWGLPATFVAGALLSLAACGYLALAVRPATLAAATQSSSRRTFGQ